MSKNKSEPIGYVVWYCERLRDGQEERSKMFKSIQSAVDWIEKMSNGFFGCNLDFELFEVGRKIPIEFKVEEYEKVKTESVRKVHVNRG